MFTYIRIERFLGLFRGHGGGAHTTKFNISWAQTPCPRESRRNVETQTFLRELGHPWAQLFMPTKIQLKQGLVNPWARGLKVERLKAAVCLVGTWAPTT